MASAESQPGIVHLRALDQAFSLNSVDFRRCGLCLSAKHGELSVATTPASTRRLRLDEDHLKPEMMEKRHTLWQLVQRTPQQIWGTAVLDMTQDTSDDPLQPAPVSAAGVRSSSLRGSHFLSDCWERRP